MARAGHDALIAIELAPVVAGVFTVLNGVTGDIALAGQRAIQDVTSHGNGQAEFCVDPVNVHQPITVNGNFQFDDSTHDHLTGLQFHYETPGNVFGFMFRGPQWVAGTDEVTYPTGFLTGFTRTAPERANPVMFTAVYQPTGSKTIDGVVFN
jgi:hypothetical protein